MFEKKKGKLGSGMGFTFVVSGFRYLNWVARGWVPLPNGYAHGGDSTTIMTLPFDWIA